MGSEEEDLKAVETLVTSADFKEFVRLAESRPPNVFRIAGIQSKEVYLTRVVGWLLAPGESHNLGQGPLRSLLLLAAARRPGERASEFPRIADVYQADLSDARVQTEYRFRVDKEDSSAGGGESGQSRERQIDILVECPAEGLLVVIENKVWASQGATKQADYLKVREQGPYAQKGLELVPILLSPYARKPECREYSSVAYKDWIPELNGLSPPGGTRGIVVEQFIASMEEILEMDGTSNKIGNLRLALWHKHREAMELLIQWSPEAQLFRDIEQHIREHGFAGWRVRPTATYMTIYPPNRSADFYYCVSLNYPLVRVGVGFKKGRAIEDELGRYWRKIEAEALNALEQAHGRYEWFCYYTGDLLPGLCWDEVKHAEPEDDRCSLVKGIAEALGWLRQHVPLEGLQDDA